MLSLLRLTGCMWSLQCSCRDKKSQHEWKQLKKSEHSDKDWTPHRCLTTCRPPVPEARSWLFLVLQRTEEWALLIQTRCICLTQRFYPLTRLAWIKCFFFFLNVSHRQTLVSQKCSWTHSQLWSGEQSRSQWVWFWGLERFYPTALCFQAEKESKKTTHDAYTFNHYIQ